MKACSRRWCSPQTPDQRIAGALDEGRQHLAVVGMQELAVGRSRCDIGCNGSVMFHVGLSMCSSRRIRQGPISAR